MYSKHILLFLILFPLILKAQILELAIQEEGRPVLNSSILKNGTIHTSNEDGFISIPVKSKDRITIKHELYKDFTFQLSDSLKSSDTLNRVIELTPKSNSYRIQSFDEFIVSGSKYENVFKNRDEFIIDYFPLPSNKFLLITYLKRNYFIKIIDELEDEKIIKQLDFKPEEIFLDALGNFHLIEKDSVYQVYFKKDSIHLMKPIDKYEFNKELENLVSIRKKGAIHQTINKHNQLFSLTQLNNGEIRIVYQVFHSEQYKMAVHYYNKTVDFYMRTIREADNIILMGIWDGTLMTLNSGFPKDNVEMNSDDMLIIFMIGWSDKIASRPLNVKSYGLNEEIIILDGVNDSIVKIRNEDLHIKKVKAQFTLSEDYFHDYFYDKVYMFSDAKGEIIVSKINTDDGTLQEITKITDIRQPRNIKVINDKVFFTVLDENGFNRIVKVKE